MGCFLSEHSTKILILGLHFLHINIIYYVIIKFTLVPYILIRYIQECKNNKL